MGREALVQRTHGVETLGQDQRRAGLQPVDPRPDADLGRGQRLVQRRQVEGELHPRPSVERQGHARPSGCGRGEPKCRPSLARRKAALSRRKN